jgi:nucleoside-diphosphate-sugar epimerase
VIGTILAVQEVHNGTAINLGTMERARPINAVHKVLRYTGDNAEIELHTEMPTGPLNRVADNALMKKLVGWKPQVKFSDGLHRTIDWYFSTKNQQQVRQCLEAGALTERLIGKSRG